MNRFLALIIASLLSLLTVAIHAQEIITTVAGGGPNNVPAVSANLYGPWGIAIDGAGNRYIASFFQNRIFKVDNAGQLTVVAGNGTPGFSGDGGKATSATLSGPTGVAVDGNGNLYIGDTNNDRIRRVDRQGIITTVAGNGVSGFSGDGGHATSAALNFPLGVSVDSSDNLYIADQGNNRIRRVDANGIITTVAGNGTHGFSGDGGPATSAALGIPAGITVDGNGNLYIADQANNRIRRVDTNGTIITVAGNGTQGFGGDGGQATSAAMSLPFGVALDNHGNLYIADYFNNRIRRVDASGIITTMAGNGTQGFSGDGGPATSAALKLPSGVAVDGSGRLYIADYSNNRIRQVASGIVTTDAGNGSLGFSGNGMVATAASLFLPNGVATDSSGNLYIADRNNHRIRRVDAATGVITTVAGNGNEGFSGDGESATAASLNYPIAVALDSVGNLYLTDANNFRVRRVDAATGIITTVAGTGNYGYNGDGIPAITAQLASPTELAVDSGDNLYIVDSGNHRIRKVDAGSGIITTVAGKIPGFSGDGGPATEAGLTYPYGVAVDNRDNLFISDLANNRIRRVDAATGIITTVAGNNTYGFSGDGGPATSASLFWPAGVALDSKGNLYIADNSNQRIRRVDAATGIITTVAGNGTYGFSGDGGLATAASLTNPIGIAVDGSGQLFIADSGNNRIRALLSPVGALDKLVNEITNSNLPPNIKSSMTTRLGTARNKVIDNNPSNNAAACGILKSLQNQIAALQKSDRLGTLEAADLSLSAETARQVIGCRQK